MKKMIFRKCGFEKNIYFRLLKNKKVNIYQIFKKIIDFNKLKKTSEKLYDCWIIFLRSIPYTTNP